MAKVGLTPDGVVKKALVKAPQQIARYAQGVLLLFAVASIVAGWSGNKLATVVLTAVIVIGFMVALLGFERLARARNGYYAKLAIVLITTVLAAVLTLFVTVLIYIGSGYPVWLDTFFGNRTPAAPSVSIEKEDSDSITLNLAAYPDPNGIVEVLVFDAQGNPVRDPQSFDATVETLVLGDLEPASRYRVRVTAIVKNRPSAPQDVVTATDAERLRIDLPVGGGVFRDAYYTGKLTSDLVPEADEAIIEFREAGLTWMFQGPVSAGVPSGRGRLSSSMQDGSACDAFALEELGQCTSGCEAVEFDNGSLISSDCKLILSQASYRENDTIFLTDGAAVFAGNLAGAAGDTINMLGPYPVAFDGEGVFKSKDVLMIGNWRANALEGEGTMEFKNGTSRAGLFEQGQLREGQVLGETIGDATVSYEVSRFVPTGAASVLSPREFLFGTMSGQHPFGPFRLGFRGKVEDSGFVLTSLEGGHLSGTEFRPVLDPASGDCRYRETFGMDVDESAMRDKGWDLHSINHLEGISDSSGEPPDYEIWLRLSPADIEVNAFKYPNEAADIRFRVGNNFSVLQQLAIDGEPIETNTIVALRQAHAGLTLARLCGAKLVTNLTNGQSTEIDGICPALALFLGRTYYCSPKPDHSMDSPWLVQEMMGNWSVLTSKDGNDPAALTAMEGSAALKTTTDGLDFSINLRCRLSEFNVFALALWGPNLTGASVGDTVQFKFTSADAEYYFNLPMPRGGVFEITDDLRQTISDLLRSTDTLAISFLSFTGETVSAEFAPTGWADALAAVSPTCPV
jgi:hypothetical protein